MKYDRMFLRCAVCGNIVEVVEDSGVPMICCGEEMGALEPNTVDAAVEKHMPVAEWHGNQLIVTVSSSPHVMTEAHHIAWIAVAQEGRTQRAVLDKTGSPCASFCVEPGDVTLYEYCNLHGLWAADCEGVGFEEMVCSAEFSEGCK